MTKEKKRTVMQKLLDKGAVNNTSVFVQAIVLVLLVIVSISSIFVKEFAVSVKALLAMLLLTMAYNNYFIFKRKGFTVIYSLVGIFFMVVAVLEAYGQ